MNNLHRELAPVSAAAWEQIEDEARRTFKRNVAARRAVDVIGPEGPELSAVGTGHVKLLASPDQGIQLRRREVQAVIELRAPFTVTRDAVDDVERGAQDSDWQPVKDAAAEIAHAEDRAVVYGVEEAGIGGIIPGSSNPAINLPSEVREIPDAVAQAASALRLAGVNGPASLLLPADLYTKVTETTDHGYPISEHIARMLHGDGEILWAPAIKDALLVSTRGGDYALYLGQDVSIGYSSHDATSVELYLQESLTFFAYTAEASVSLSAG